MNNPNPIEKWLKVFLVEPTDLVKPSGYTHAFFNDLFFSRSKSLINPEGGKLKSSVKDYFYDVSNGYVDVKGQVVSWTKVDEEFMKIPHWVNNTTAAAFEAIIAVAAASCLKKNGIKNKSDLNIGGNEVDGLAFVVVDYIGGGARRNLNTNSAWSVKSQLQALNRMDLWDDAWDSWDIEFLFVPCCRLDPRPMTLNDDGTLDNIPIGSNLGWFPYSVLMHELGHLVLGFPDLYGSTYGPWNQMDIMHFGKASDFPGIFSAFLQREGGWFNMEEMKMRTQPLLRLDPIETHSQAFEFPMGIGIKPEVMVVENRHRWGYWGDPEENLGNALIFYRQDRKVNGRIIVPRQDGTPVRRVTTLLIRPENWGEVWGINGANTLDGQGENLVNSLNYLGEHWWDFSAINVQGDNAIDFDALFKGIDVLRKYNEAIWSNGDGELITPDFFNSNNGHVGFVNRTMELEDGQRYDRALNLFPQWKVNGKIKGDFSLTVPGVKSGRLYIEVILSETTKSKDGVVFCVKSEGKTTDVSLTNVRNYRIVATDFDAIKAGRLQFEIEVSGNRNAINDNVFITKAIFVPTADIKYDFLANAPSGKWVNKDGANVFANRITRGSCVMMLGDATLYNGTVFGHRNLFTMPDPGINGYVEGIYNMVIPNSNTIFRAELGFSENRLARDKARIFIQFNYEDKSKGEVLLLNGLSVDNLNANSEENLEINALTAIAIKLPSKILGHRGDFIIKVVADGSFIKSGVIWTMAKLTAN